MSDDEPIAELWELRLEPPDDFHERLLDRLSRRELGRQVAEGGLAMVGRLLICFAVSLVEAMFGKRVNDEQGAE